MQAKDTINLLLENSPSGTITAKQVTECGVHRSVLQELVETGDLYRYGRGLYIRSDTWEDDFYLLQCKYGRGIYSHDTSLYLLGYSDRTPAKYTMTFPKGYNAPSLKQESIIIRRVIPDNYSFGIIEIKSPSGNPIMIYDLERTLCDIVRGSCVSLHCFIYNLNIAATSTHNIAQRPFKIIYHIQPHLMGIS